MEKPYSTEIENLEDLDKYLEKEIGISEWFDMSQDKVNKFAELTEDKQWIHIDQEKAAKYSPYKKTIARVSYTFLCITGCVSNIKDK